VSGFGVSSWAASITSDYGFGPDDQRLASLVVQRHQVGQASETLRSLTYTYDTAGNLRKSEDLLAPKLLEQDFGYDAVHRLSHVVASGNLGYGLHSYAYDDAGNLTEKGPLNLLGQPAQGRLKLIYGRTAAQPTSVVRVDRHDGSTFVPGHAFYAYHEDGNASWRQVAGQQQWLTRALDGTLEQVTFSGQDRDAFYADDAEGLRAAKLVASGPWWSVVEESRFNVDTSFEVDTLNDRHEVHLFVGGRRIATSHRTGLGNGSGSWTVESITTYHPDQVGTNTLAVERTSTAHTLSRTALEPFGQKLASSGTAPRHLFTDQERDGESGLDDFGARTYDPLVGRFLEQDPALIGPALGVTFSRITRDSQNVNPYSYVLNRPTVAIDVNGLWAVWFGFSGSGGTGGWGGTGYAGIGIGSDGIGGFAGRGWGGYGGIGGGVGFTIGWSPNASGVKALDGPGFQVGGSYGTNASVTVEAVGSKGWAGGEITISPPYTSYNVEGFETHGFVTKTSVSMSGRLEKFSPQPEPIEFLQLGISAGSVDYWSRLPNLGIAAALTFKTVHANLDFGLVQITYCQLLGKSSIRSIDFGIPVDRPGSRQLADSLGRRLLETMKSAADKARSSEQRI
jgi:RHS repeat-associated protein